jgi:hypothetical protein
MTGFIKNTVAKRLEGDRPSVVRAVAVAIPAGVAAAVVTYKLMRTRA